MLVNVVKAVVQIAAGVAVGNVASDGLNKLIDVTSKKVAELKKKGS